MSHTFENVDAFAPQAPPPAAPPPPPPATTPQKNSYGSTSQAYGQKPTITNYYDDYSEPSPASKQAKRSIPADEQPNHDPTTSSSARGDVSIRPNIGESNAAIGQESLRESLVKVRIVNLAACACALILEVPNLVGHVFSIHPARAVLGMYLTFFALLVCGYELDFHQRIRETIQHYFGVLHHPIGRSLILLLMGGLAMGQGGIFDIILGVVFAWSALFTAVTFVWFPEYRRRTTIADGEGQRESLYQHAVTAGRRAWAEKDLLANGAAMANTAAETASLLHKSLQTKK